MIRALLLALQLFLAPAAVMATERLSYPPETLQALDRELDPAPLTRAKDAITLVHVWATWCVSCRDELPSLAALNAKLADEPIGLVAVSIDRMGWDVINKTLNELTVSGLNVLQDPNRDLVKRMKIRALPTTLIISASGEELKRIEGPREWNTPDFLAELRALAKIN